MAANETDTRRGRRELEETPDGDNHENMVETGPEHGPENKGGAQKEKDKGEKGESVKKVVEEKETNNI